eukprot:GFKZ01000688.1.p1 GENE.GFKZ01000688.1~~GFKZ01000688.1.p1  ORF type:complete len:514 (+),score=109.15 GFKZ01000688.1:107-1648(+)
MPSTASKRSGSPLPLTRPLKRERRNSPSAHLSPLQSLLQFWLSPSNLSKDQFLSSAMLKNDGWIPVSLFTTFNKAIALNATSSDILAGLQSLPSPFLEFRDITSKSEFRLQGGISKLQQLISKARKNEDDRTIYVESLAPSATREQVQNSFSRFGNIAYLSIPRFRNGRCKGFCFVEFLETEAARCALQHVNEQKIAIGGDGETRALWRADWRHRKEMFKEEVRKKKLEEARKRHGFQVVGESNGRGGEEEDEVRGGRGGRQRRMKRKGANRREERRAEGAKLANEDAVEAPRVEAASEEARERTAAGAKREIEDFVNEDVEDEHGMKEAGDVEAYSEDSGGKGPTNCGRKHGAPGEGRGQSAGEEQEERSREGGGSIEREEGGKSVEEEGKVSKGHYKAGLILEVSGLEKQVSRKDVYQGMKRFGKVAFVDMSWGPADVCRIRFDDVEGVPNALKGIAGMTEGGLGPQKNGKIVGRVIVGSEEEEYWKHVRERQGRVKERWERKRSKAGGKG